MVCENRATAWTGSCTGGQRTDYRYDVGSRLTRVCQQPSGASCGQTREFLYDQRGLLTAERHPEIGAAGNGRTFYTYDALGNVLTKDLDGTEKFDLGFAYDPASRLIRVEEPDPFAPACSRSSSTRARTRATTSARASSTRRGGATGCNRSRRCRCSPSISRAW